MTFHTGHCLATTVNTTTSSYMYDFSTTGGTLNITNNVSGLSTNGYGNFTAQIVSQVRSGTINFNANNTGTQGFRIWVDWNDNLSFADAGDLVYQGAGTNTLFTGSFVVPAGAAYGDHIMRIRCHLADANPPACGTVAEGETEDYTLTVICSGNPSGLTVTPITNTTATVNWTAASPAPGSGYEYYVSTSPTAPVTSTVATGTGIMGTSVNITGLTADTFYYVWVRSNCNGTVKMAWVPLTFQTGEATLPPVTTGTTI